MRRRGAVRVAFWVLVGVLGGVVAWAGEGPGDEMPAPAPADETQTVAPAGQEPAAAAAPGEETRADAQVDQEPAAEGGDGMTADEVPTEADLERGRELIARAVEGLGGAPTIDGLKTLEFRGKGTRKVPGGSEMPVETTTRILFPDRFRHDVSLPFGVMSSVVTPEQAFLLVGGAAMPLGDNERGVLEASFRRQLVALLRSRHEPDFVAAYAGETTLDDEPAALVAIQFQGDKLTLAVDVETGHVLRLQCPDVSTGQGPTGELTVFFSDFRQAGPLVYPFRSRGEVGGNQVYDATLEGIEVDVPLDEDLFVAPEPAEAPPAEAGSSKPGAPTPTDPEATEPSSPAPETDPAPPPER